jgi:hypothetical protein
MPRDQPLYYPTQKGARWVYLDGDADREYVVSGAEQNKSSDATIVTISEVNGENQKPWRAMAVSRRGLVWLEASGSAFDEPIWVLRCPVVVNDELPYRAFGSGVAVCEGTMKVVGFEEVEVPAGKFSAVRVEDAFTLGGRKHCWTYWFVQEVGFVRYDFNSTKMVLKSFKPGKN